MINDHDFCIFAPLGCFVAVFILFDVTKISNVLRSFFYEKTKLRIKPSQVSRLRACSPGDLRKL